MINRGRVLRLAMGGASSITDDEMAELCRVYLAWLDAPSATVNQFGEGLIEGGSVSAGRLAGKRIRMVEVK